MSIDEDFEARLRAGLRDELASVAVPAGLTARLTATARGAAERTAPVPARGGRRRSAWMLPLASAAAVLVVVGGTVLLISHDSGNGHSVAPPLASSSTGTSPEPSPDVSRSAVTSPTSRPSSTAAPDYSKVPITSVIVVPPVHTPVPPATQQVVLYPVTSSGRPAAGYSVTSTSQSIDCSSYVIASPVAKSADILRCSPNSAGAIACWHSQDPHRALCLVDPIQRRLVSYPLTAGFGGAQPRAAVPFGLQLSDGTNCALRNGGAWAQPVVHPDWEGYYLCDRGTAVWAPASALSTEGINESKAAWTVQVGAQSRPSTYITRNVVAAYYVATATG